MSSRMPSPVDSNGLDRAYAARAGRAEKIPAGRETPRAPLSGGAPGRVRYRDFAQPVKCGCTACVGRAHVRNDMLTVRAGPAPERNCTRARTRWTPTRRRRGSTRALYSPSLDARGTPATRRPATKNVTRRIWRPRTRRVTGLVIGQVRTAAMRAEPRRTSTPLTAPAGAAGVALTGVGAGTGGGTTGGAGGWLSGGLSGGLSSGGTTARQEWTSNDVTGGKTSMKK